LRRRFFLLCEVGQHIGLADAFAGGGHCSRSTPCRCASSSALRVAV
jgi:hypothetical protein